MFGGKFSLIRFSLPSKVELEIKIRNFFIESVHSLISFGANALAENSFRENMHNNLIATRGIEAGNEFIEDLSAEVAANSDYFVVNVFRENALSDVYLASDFYVQGDFAESTDSKIYMGKDTLISNGFRESLKINLFAVKNITATHNFREEIFSTIYSAILDKDIFTINVNIPPGGELRIDSENYTVALNGASIIHLYDGGWINISRETIDISIAANKASMTGTLSYLERFL